MTKPIHIVDLFAGPGGLGEGFSSVRNADGDRVFKTLVSVEKEASAHRTLTLRAFYRILLDKGEGMDAYFDYVKGGDHPATREDSKAHWQEAEREALRLELGGEPGNHALDEKLRASLDRRSDWVLIGGPPCQAYSVVGRVRNRGNKDYRPEEDKRHFLYREYLNVIDEHRPAVFVMENVKGILTSRIGKERIFGQILKDLCDPAAATDPNVDRGPSIREDGYTIFSLVDEHVRYPRISDLFPDIIEPLGEDEYNAFVIKTEQHGIPQARHRVILVGVRNDLVDRIGSSALARQLNIPKAEKGAMVPASKVLADLPALRSGLSRDDSDEAWYSAIKKVANHVADELIKHQSENVSREVANKIAAELRNVAREPHVGLNRWHSPATEPRAIAPTSTLERWYHGAHGSHHKALWLNHYARSHMEEDLARYLYCATFAKVVGRSPTGTKEIYLDYLAPMHVNWKSGKFADRFRVVLDGQPSKTITSHISKDGHYFIHYDPYQCRSLTVREAARLQTFPDDYYFEGNRTEQYVQVGNAVPPLLAKQIAEKVVGILELQTVQVEALLA